MQPSSSGFYGSDCQSSIFSTRRKCGNSFRRSFIIVVQDITGAEKHREKIRALFSVSASPVIILAVVRASPDGCSVLHQNQARIRNDM